MNSKSYASDFPNWMRRLPLWMRTWLARRARNAAHKHADRAFAERDEAERLSAFAEWLMTEERDGE